MRALFFGSPDFAVPCLDALHEIADVVAVVTQPDRPKGRGLTLAPPAVKVRAEALGLPVLQPTRIKPPSFAAELVALGADVGVVVAYGRILPRAVLDAPRLGCVNVHASLLPRWRGAAPIHWAIVHGDAETGVCLMQVDEGLDSGPVLARAQTPIDADETAGELFDRLSLLGAEVLRRELPRFVAGALPAEPQVEADATYAKMLEKTDGRVDFARSAREVHDRVRGMSPWPGAYADLEGARVKLHRSHVVEVEGSVAPSGTVVGADPEGIRVACGRGVVAIDELQESGRKRLGAAQYLAGHPSLVGRRFDPVDEEGA